MRGYNLAKNVAKLAAGVKMFSGKGQPKGGIKKGSRRMLKRKYRRKFRRKRRGRARITANDVHSGISTDTIYCRLNKPLKGKTESRFKYLQIYSGYLTDYAGTQGVGQVFSIATRQAFLNGTGGAPNIYQTKNALYDMNPMRLVTGNSVIGSAAPVDERLALYNVRVTSQFTNMENVAVTMKLFVCTPKVHTGVYPSQAWQDSNASEAYGITVPSRAAGGAYGANAGQVDQKWVGTTPWDTKLFHRMWKVLKVHKLQLAGGATEEVNFHFAINKIVRKEYLNELAVDFLKGQNITVMACWYGQPVHDVTQGGVSLNVTTATTNIAHYTTVKYNLGALKSISAPPSSFNGNNPTAWSTDVTKQQFANIVDAVATVIQA